MRYLGPALGLALALSACSEAEESEEPRRCNGHAELCDRPLDQVALPSTHNSMSSSDEGWLAPNHRYPPQRQLDDGIRGMLLDTYLWNDEPYLCHGFCEAGATPLVDVLSQLTSFFRENPDDVMVIIFENNIDAETLDGSMREADLDGLRYTHPPGSPWPTLAELADQGTPLLVTVERPGPDDPPWHHDFYAIGFDTPYNFREAEDFTCDVLRGSEVNDLFLLNHWLSRPLPTRDGAREVNTAEILGARARECAEVHGRIPNLVAVDHYDVGDLFEVVEELNGLGEQR